MLEEAQGGADVKVEDLDLGGGYEPETSWVGFRIAYDYPRAQVYPFYLRPDLARANGVAFQPPINLGQTLSGFNEPAIMVSRGSNRWNPARDTAALASCGSWNGCERDACDPARHRPALAARNGR